MKKNIIYFFFLFLLFLVQVAALKVFSQSVYLVPQFLLLFVIALSLNNSLPESVWFAFIAGFFAELFSGLFFGTHILGLVAVSLAVYTVTRNLTSQQATISTTVFLVILGTLLMPFIAYLFNLLAAFLYSSPVISIRNFYYWTIFWTLISNIVFAYPIAKLFKFFSRFEEAK